MQEVHIKAVPVNGLYQFVARELTPEQLRTVLERLGADSRYFTGHLLAHDMVPLSVVNRFTTLAATEKKEPVRQFARRAGRFGADLGVKSVYKFILAVLSIEYVLRKATFMWSRVYDGGKMEVDASPNRARVRVTEFPGNEAGCGRITGWFEVIGERAGAKNLHCTHTTCVAEGASECAWDFDWR
jgi:hypothetical protein